MKNKCTICGALETNKSTCPYNKKAKNINKEKHNDLSMYMTMYKNIMNNFCNKLKRGDSELLSQKLKLRKKYTKKDICSILKEDIDIIEIKKIFDEMHDLSFENIKIGGNKKEKNNENTINIIEDLDEDDLKKVKEKTKKNWNITGKKLLKYTLITLAFLSIFGIGISMLYKTSREKILTREDIWEYVRKIVSLTNREIKNISEEINIYDIYSRIYNIDINKQNENKTTKDLELYKNTVNLIKELNKKDSYFKYVVGQKLGIYLYEIHKHYE